MSFFKNLLKTTALFLLLSTNTVYADDIGINSARLVQVSDSTYVFEAEFSQLVILDYEAPIFPERFILSEPILENKAGWITIRIQINFTGKPLNNEDEILLPWRRNGVSLTLQTTDGSIYQGLYLRDIDGIHIPLKTLISWEKSSVEVIEEGFSMAWNHLKFFYVYLLLVLALVFLLPKRTVFGGLIYFAFGQAFSMILFEMGIPGIDVLFVDLLILLLVIIIVLCVFKKTVFQYLNWVLCFLGLLLGLSVAREIEALDMAMASELISLFTFNLAIALILFITAFLMVTIVSWLKTMPKLYEGLKYLSGTLAVFSILLLFSNNVITGKTDIMAEDALQNNVGFAEFAQQNQSQATTRPQAAQTMTNPILSYLSIEPFEVRHEILITASEALNMLNMPMEGLSEIPIDSLETIKTGILDLMATSTTLQIEGQEVNDILSRVDFVTLGMSGVLIRLEEVPESFEDGILGISFVYETTTLPNSLSLEWVEFPRDLEFIEATTIDPFGGESFFITSEEPVLNWESSLSGYTVPQVEEVAIESPRLSLLSFGLIIIALVLLFLANRLGMKKYWAYTLLALAFVLYPFVRSPLNVDFIKQWKPSNERSTGIINSLLTNVYRSFDYRKESDMYDRLALSITGDELSEIYIQQRKGLEIENRGGAKAKVNGLEILEVYGVEKGPKNNFGVEVSWKINGSVSHFGHMHYRQNQYRAIIWIVPANGTWKIERIEMLDEERLL